jgi:AraC-like DNA-binding protein
MKYAPGFRKQIDYLIDELAEQNGLWPLRAGHHFVRPDTVLKPKMIEYYGLHFVVNGKMIYCFNDQQIECRKGDVFCVYPEVVYRHLYFPEEETLELIWLSIDGPKVPLLLESAQFTPTVPYVRNVISLELETLLRNLFDKHYDESRKSKVKLYAAIYRMFGLIIPEEDKSQTKAGPDQWVPLSLDYMNTHFAESINVQDVADYVSIHRVYFTKIFTQHVGITPLHYLQKLRMERALYLLRHSTRTITEIALSLGYADLYAFTRAFSNLHGMSPSAYREGRQRVKEEQ